LSHTLCYYKEYDFGHLGFLIPPDKRIFFDILELARRHNSEIKCELGATPTELLSKTNIADLEEEVTKIMVMMQTPVSV